MNTQTKNTPLENVLSMCGGSQATLSIKTGIKASTISAWFNRYNHRVGHEYVLTICQCFGYAVTPHELRPDLYPYPDDALPYELRKSA